MSLQKMSDDKNCLFLLILMSCVSRRNAGPYTYIETPKQSADNNSYKYTQLSQYGIEFHHQTYMRFEVKATTNAVVALMVTDSDMDAHFHIKISGWDNTITKIGRTRSDYLKEYNHENDGLLDPNTYKEMEVSWGQNKIAISAWIDGKWTNFLTYELSTSINIAYVGVSTGFWGVGAWRIYPSNDSSTTSLPVNPQLTTAEEKFATTTEVEVVDPQVTTTAAETHIITTEEKVTRPAQTPSNPSATTPEAEIPATTREQSVVTQAKPSNNPPPATSDSDVTSDAAASITKSTTMPPNSTGNEISSFSSQNTVVTSTENGQNSLWNGGLNNEIKETPTTESPTNNSSNCRIVQQMNNVTVEELLSEIKQLKEELHVEKDSTSMSRNAKISAPDPRTSAAVIGLGGSIFMAVVFGGVIFVDLPNLKLMFQTMLNNICS